MRCLKKMPAIVDNLSVKKICVDDFALRKRFSYGSVMVDIETHRIIDLIPSRDTADVRVWLKQYPNVEVISRDGSQIYANAATGAYSHVKQVSDRFHLIKGLSESIDKYIIREYPSRLEIPAVTVQTKEMAELLNIKNRAKRIKFAHEKIKEGMTVSEVAFILHSSLKTITKYLNIDPLSVDDKTIARESLHELAVTQKQKDVEEVRKLASKGIPIEQIAKMTHHTYKTIQNYLNPSYAVVNGHYNVRIPNKLSPYESKIIELRKQGVTYQKIHELISADGYDGTVASLRMFMQKERIRHAELEQDGRSNENPKEYIQRKSLSQLLYKKLNDVYTITKEQYDQVLKSYPLLAELYSVIKEFYEIIYSKHSERLDLWLQKLEAFNIPELQTYVNGIRKDVEAVKNGIENEYNNGLAEGSVNKIKVIKRIMYGRNSFELLKAKILFHEQFYCEFN